MKRMHSTHPPSRFRTLEDMRAQAQKCADRDEEPVVLVDDHGEIVPVLMRKAARYEASHHAQSIPGERFYPEPRGAAA